MFFVVNCVGILHENLHTLLPLQLTVTPASTFINSEISPQFVSGFELVVGAGLFSSLLFSGAKDKGLWVAASDGIPPTHVILIFLVKKT